MKKDRIMLLGSGELGREFVISAKRLGAHVIAVDLYKDAPAMQLADAFEVIDMLNGEELERIVEKHQPDYIVPEVEAIRTEKLLEFESKGFEVIPTARATRMTMDRVEIRDLAATQLGLRTARYAYASSLKELEEASQSIAFPCVVKPVMSSSGKGQSTCQSPGDLKSSWENAQAGMRGDKSQVIIEEFIQFESEITLLTIKQRKGETLFVDPIGHRQVDGDYRESWVPAEMKPAQLEEAQRMAKHVTDELGGAGLFGVEFFLTKNEVVFSELSPRPHDTGMVTLIGQNLSEFDLHARAVLGLPIPKIQRFTPAAASAVILADKSATQFEISGEDEALQHANTDLRIFRKPSTRPGRRMGVALAHADSTAEARGLARTASEKVKID